MWTDAGGRDWTTTVTGATVKRVKELTDVLLTDVAETDLLERLSNDVILLCNVLYAVCKPQCDQRQITDADFGELLVGDRIDHAYQSLTKDLIDFFPSRRRELVARIAAATQAVQTAQVRLIDRKMSEQQIADLIQRAAGQAERQIDQILAEFGDPSGKSPES